MALLVGKVISSGTVSLDTVVDASNSWVWNAGWVNNASVSALGVGGRAFSKSVTILRIAMVNTHKQTSKQLGMIELE